MNRERILAEIPKSLLQIAERICAAGGRSYLVGGFVRDALLGIPSRDFDVEVYGIEQKTLLDILKNFGRPNLVGRAFGVVHLVTRGLELDFSFPRTESKIGEGHRGFLVETHLNLTFEEAARRRDFTVNAMGLSLPDLELSDPYDGKGDLERKILRHVSPAFSEDSLRVLRGVQFASRFSLALSPETAKLCRSLSLADLSPERLFEEFKKWLLKPGRPSFGLAAFCEMDLFRFFPEISPWNGSLENLGILLDHVSEELDRVPDLISKEVLAFSALLSGAGNSDSAKTFLARMTNEVQLLKRVPVFCAFIPELLSRAKIQKAFEAEFMRRSSVAQGGLFLSYLYLKSAAPFFENGVESSVAETFRATAEELNVFEAPPEPWLRGADLIQMGLKPGKRIGEIIHAEFDLQLQGKILSREAALDFGKSAISNGIV